MKEGYRIALNFLGSMCILVVISVIFLWIGKIDRSKVKKISDKKVNQVEFYNTGIHPWTKFTIDKKCFRLCSNCNEPLVYITPDPNIFSDKVIIGATFKVSYNNSETKYHICFLEKDDKKFLHNLCNQCLLNSKGAVSFSSEDLIIIPNNGGTE